MSAILSPPTATTKDHSRPRRGRRAKHLPMRDMIPLSQVVREVPSIKGGKIHINTLYRWIHTGKLRAWKIGGNYFVLPRDLRRLAQRVRRPEPVALPATGRQLKAEARWQDAAGAEIGL